MPRVRAEKGILRSEEFAGLTWDAVDAPAPLGDVLRVHEWAYVRSLEAACAAIANSPEAVGLLDADTAVSHQTLHAARVAAGCVCRAIDKVMAGEVRILNAHPVRNYLLLGGHAHS